MGFKKLFRDYLEYYPSEKRGVFYLSVIIVIWVVGLYFYNQMPVPAENDEAFEKAVAEYYSSLDRSERNPVSNESQKPAQREWNLFAFDPNTISVDSLQLLGLQENTASAIVNYRNSGGYFKTPEDLAKIYTLSDSDFIVVQSFIQIKRSDTNEEESYRSWDSSQEYSDTSFTRDSGASSFDYEPVIVELNIADTAALKKIRGVGSYYASEIVEHRNALGGYLSLEQLMEIYKLDRARLDELAPHFTLDTSLVERININTVSIDELRKHPYFPYSIANSIVKMREAHGLYKQVGDIRKSHLVNDSIFKRIKPYLSVHD